MAVENSTTASRAYENKVRGNLKFISILTAIVCSYGILLVWNFKPEQNFENLALGTQTQSFFSQKDQFPIHIERLDHSLNEMKEGWLNRGSKNVALILGNSQTHSINQIKSGERTYVDLLFDEYSESIDVLSFSAPNASFMEMYVGLLALYEEFPLKYLIIPAFLDDTRESGVRPTFFPGVSDAVSSYFSSIPTELGRKITVDLQNVDRPDAVSNEGMEGLRQTTQEIVEVKLDKFLTDNSPVWKNRERFRGDLFVGLYRLRNTAFQINAQTKRPVITTNYNTNMESLEGIFDYSEEQGIQVLWYIPPIRYDIDIPYVIDEYDNFKHDLEQLTRKFSNISFDNFEKLVPAALWGMKESTTSSNEAEYDFMHFQYGGHELLYQKIDSLLSHNIDDF